MISVHSSKAIMLEEVPTAGVQKYRSAYADAVIQLAIGNGKKEGVSVIQVAIESGKKKEIAIGDSNKERAIYMVQLVIKDEKKRRDYEIGKRKGCLMHKKVSYGVSCYTLVHGLCGRLFILDNRFQMRCYSIKFSDSSQDYL